MAAAGVWDSFKVVVNFQNVLTVSSVLFSPRILSLLVQSPANGFAASKAHGGGSALVYFAGNRQMALEVTTRPFQAIASIPCKGLNGCLGSFVEL